jgi:mycothiol synthase
MTETLVLRPFCGEDDFPRLAGILTASEQADSLSITFTVEAVAKLLRDTPRFDLSCDLVIAELDGQPIAYGRVVWFEDAASRKYDAGVYVVPERRGQGVDRSLMDWLEERARAIAAEQPTGKQEFLRANTTQYQVDLAALLVQRGYHVVESWSLMIRPSLEDIPDTPLPAGLEVRPYQPEDLPAIWYAVEEAYVPEGGPPPSGVFPEDFRNSTFQPELWQVAWDVATNRVVGSVMTYIHYLENKAMGIQRGYTEGISTVPGWQRRGVAKALIARSLKVQRALGMTESGLVVSSLKPGNRKLYESCGFQEVKKDTVYEKPLA